MAARKPEVLFVSRSVLYPAFGDARENPPRIRVRKDLPRAVQDFVLVHEYVHIGDWQRLAQERKEYNWIWGDVRAGFFGSVRHPVGFLLSLVLSLHPDRLKLYVQRFFRGS